jgi:hypothetical protein
MGISILTEPIAGGRFRATTGDLFGLEVEADSRDLAKERLTQLIEQRIRCGARLETIEISSDANQGLYTIAGDMKDDPWLEPWQQAMRDYRQEMEAAEAE